MKYYQVLPLLLLSIKIFSQCPEGTVYLYHQYQVDLFTEKYFDCEYFDGTLVIGSPNGIGSAYDFSDMPRFKFIRSLIVGNSYHLDFDFIQDIINLERLDVKGTDNLENLEFLKHVEQIKEITISDNSSLFNIDDLQVNVDSIEAFRLTGNLNLNVCDNPFLCEVIANEDIPVYISENASGGCGELSAVAEYCGTAPPFPYTLNYFHELKDQGDIDSFNIRFSSFSKIFGLRIVGGPDSDIVSLKPLEGIDSINYLSIYQCDSLSSLEGLDMSYIYRLSISNCGSLKTLNEINNIQTLSNLSVYSCDEISTLSDVIFSDLNVQNLIFSNLPNLDQEPLNMQEINGELEISELNWTDLSALSNIKMANSLRIRDMPQITNFEGLTDLDSINKLRIYRLPAINTFSGFNTVKSIKDIYIGSMDSMQTVENCFAQLQDIRYISIEGNDVLKSIEGFASSKEFGSMTIKGNAELISLDFLDKELTIPGRIWISHNPKLSECNVLGICNNLKLSTFVLYSNLQDCNSIQEISSQCFTDQKNPIFDVEITSQDEMDAFAFEYPNADSIYASVSLINESQISPITDISYFDQIAYIQEGLCLSYFSNHSIYSTFSEVDFDLLCISNSDIDTLPFMGYKDSLRSLNISFCDNLKSLKSLMGIQYIEEELSIRQCDGLLSLEGLDSLKWVKKIQLWDSNIGDISSLGKLKHVDALNISSVYGFNSLEALQSLESVNDLSIRRGSLQTLFVNNQIKSVNNLVIRDIQFIDSITGFESIKRLNNLTIDNLNLTKFDGFDQLEEIHNESPEPYLAPMGELLIRSLDGMVRFPNLKKVDRMECRDNSFIEIPMFENLDTINRLTISQNNNLESIDMFNDSTFLGSAGIWENSSLSACNVPWLCNFLDNGGEVNLGNNASDCNSISDLNFTCGRYVRCPSDDVSILTNDDLSRYLEKYETCKVLPLDFEINVSALDTRIIDSLIYVNRQLKIISHNGNVVTPNLTDVKSVIFSDLKKDFQEDYQWVDLRHLSIIETSDLDSIRISTPSISSFSFIGNENVKSIVFDEDVELSSFLIVVDNPGLKSIVGPKAPEAIYYIRVISNDDLESISGWDNADIPDYGGVEVFNNQKLEVCNITPLCNLDPNFIYSTEIHTNGELCSDLDTIQLVCEGVITSVEVPETIMDNEIMIFPNPSRNILHFRSINPTMKNFSGEVYNSLGEGVLIFQDVDQISVRQFPEGYYYVRLDNNKIFKIIKSN